MKTAITTSWLLAGRRCSRAKIVFTRLLLVSALCSLAMPARAAYREWTGAASGNWSNPNNWDPVGLPLDGDNLWFFADANKSMLNDIPNLTVSTLVFAHHDYVLSGNPLTVGRYGGGITMQMNYGSGSATINCALIIYTNGCTFECWPFVGNSGRLRINADVNLNGFNLLLYSFAPGGGGSSDIEMAGSISGNGNVTAKASGYPDGTIEFLGTADNTFTGTLFIQPNVPSSADGVYFDKDAGAVASQRVVIEAAAWVNWRNSNQLGDNATVVVKDGSRLNLNGYNETIGNLIMTNVSADAQASLVNTESGGVFDPVGILTVNDGIITWVNNATVVPTIRGILNLPSGNHNFFVSAANYDGLNLEAKVTGAGGFTKFGNAALLLKGTNTFGGTVYGGSGIIDVHNPSGFGSPAGGVVLIGGSVTLRSLTIASESLTAQGQQLINSETAGSLLFSAGSNTWTGAIQLDTNLVVSGGDMLLSGPISGVGGLDFRTFGTAQLGGGAANTYTGRTLVRCPLLQLNKPSVNAYAGPLEVGGDFGGTAEVRWLNSWQNPNTPLTVFANGVVNLVANTEDFGPITFNGGLIQTTPGILGGYFYANSSITANPATSTAIMNGNLALSANPAYFIVSNGVAEPDLLINAVILGVNVWKQGQGTLRFTGANTYVGRTIVENGILHADNLSALGTASTNLSTFTIVSNNATVRLGAIDGMSEGFQLSGSGFQGTNGALQVTGIGTMFGGVLLDSPSAINTLSGGSLAIYSVISSNGPLTKTGPGILSLGGTTHNTYSGGTIVSAGLLNLSKTTLGIVAAPGNLTIGPALASSPATARWINTGAMTAGAMVTVNANGLLDLNGQNQLLSQLNLNDGGDVQTGLGTLSFPGGGSVNVGTLNPGQPGLQASASISGRMAAAIDDYIIFNIDPYGQNPLSPDVELVVSAQIAGIRSSIAKNGQGTMWLSGNNTFDGSVSVVTEFDINAGAVIAASNTSLGGTNNWMYVLNGASLALVNYITITNKLLFLNTINPAALDNRGGDNVWTGPIEFSRDSGFSVNFGWSLTVQGAVTGTGALIKRGEGLLRLSGAANNTHSGNTYVDEGFLYLAKSASLQAVPVHLIIGRPGGGTFATVRHFGQDAIWGDITVNNGGLLDLNGFDEYFGNLTLNGGGDVQTGSGTLFPDTSVAVNPGSFADQSVIAGRLGVFAGAIPFTVGAGTLGAGNADCLISATIVPHSATAGLQKNGAGMLQLTGNNTYRGNTILTGGTLAVEGSQPLSPVQIVGGRLQGSGTVGHVIFANNKCFLAPGSSPGILTTSNLNANALGGGKVEIELNGLTVGSGYDQINVRGTVNLTQLILSPTLNFASAANDQFTIINNDGGEAVIGTFDSLPQNKKLYIGQELFQISYNGGTGNDVVLNRLVTPPPPTLTIERIPPASVRLIWASNDPAFRLQSNTNLTALTWISASPPPVVVGTNNVVTNMTTAGERFYRLINP